jgi:phage baseplate assembly protein W
MAIGYSVKLPLRYSYDDGVYALNKTLNATVQQNLKNLLLTNPGEKIMDLSFGVGLRNYIHEQLTPLTKDRIRNNILEQVKRYMPFLTVESLNILSKDETSNTGETYLNDESLSIKIEYSFAGSSNRQVLNIPIR